MYSQERTLYARFHAAWNEVVEPFNKNSGYCNSQFVILSEHYEFLFKMLSNSQAQAQASNR